MRTLADRRVTVPSRLASSSLCDGAGFAVFEQRLVDALDGLLLIGHFYGLRHIPGNVANIGDRYSVLFASEQYDDCTSFFVVVNKL